MLSVCCPSIYNGPAGGIDPLPPPAPHPPGSSAAQPDKITSLSIKREMV
jgi:hypothetical protein